MFTSALFFLFFAVYTLQYYSRRVYMPKVFTKSPLISSLLLTKIYPAFFIPTGLSESVYQLFRNVKILKSAIKMNVILEVEDGGEILLEIYEPGALNEKISERRKTVARSTGTVDMQENKKNIEGNVLLLHGLNGSSQSSYIKGMANVFLEKNCRVFCYNARGTKIPPKSNLFSHIGLTSDLKTAVEHILNNYEGALSLIGFSLGSNWVGKFLGEYSNPRLVLGMGICCPFDFMFLYTYFNSGFFTKLVENFMTKKYIKYIKRTMKVPLENLEKLRDIKEIDRCLLKVFKAASIEEFYGSGSCKTYLKDIKIPMLFINTVDDPIIPREAIPFDEISKNENIGLILAKGGHLGFFTNKKHTMVEVLASSFYDLAIKDI
ncbi:hypothetical protein ENBRE01_2241 [Enteropsectra breve]|nr:hypothetical protein ENBRE01_2241 [Enteropsectra breve]